MLTEPLLRRGPRIPSRRDARPLPGHPAERAELVRFKLARSPLLRRALDEQNWHILKSDHLRRLVAREDADLDHARPHARAGPRDRARGRAASRSSAEEARKERRVTRRLIVGQPGASTWPIASGSGSSSRSRSTPRSSATSATTTACPIRRPRDAPRRSPSCKGFLRDARRDRARACSTRRTRSRSTCSRWLRASGCASTSSTAAPLRGDGPDRPVRRTCPATCPASSALDTTERVDRLVRRLEQFPEFLAQHRVNLLDGIAAGRTAAAPVVERVIEQTRRAVERAGWTSHRCCWPIPT